MKYIVLAVKLGATMTKEIPVIFDSFLVHADVANALKKGHPHGRGFEIVAAGEWNDTHGCSGESSSLGIKSRGETDTMLINTCDYGGGLIG